MKSIIGCVYKHRDFDDYVYEFVFQFINNNYITIIDNSISNGIVKSKDEINRHVKAGMCIDQNPMDLPQDAFCGIVINIKDWY